MGYEYIRLLTQWFMWVGGVRYLFKTHATLRGGAIFLQDVLSFSNSTMPPSKDCWQSSSSIMTLRFWGTQHPSTNSYIPTLHFPELLGSALPRALCWLHPSSIAVISSSTMALAVFCLAEDIRHVLAAEKNLILKMNVKLPFWIPTGIATVIEKSPLFRNVCLAAVKVYIQL